MPINVPATIAPMPATVIMQPSGLMDEPIEGKKRVSGEIQWPVAGLTACYWDCAIGQGPSSWSRVRAIYVDNLNSDADAFFIDVSTRFQLQVPARTEGLFPVEMSGSRFIISSPLATAADSINFQAYNFLPPPIATVPPFLQNSVASAGISAAAGTTALLSSSNNGIVEGLSISLGGVLGGAAPGSIGITVQDGEAAPVVIGSCLVQTVANNQTLPNSLILSNFGINVRFKTGINVVVSASGTAFAAGAFVVNLYWR